MRFILILLTIGLAIASLGCQGLQTATKSSPTTEVSNGSLAPTAIAPNPTPTLTPAPPHGGVLTIARPGLVSSLDIHQEFSLALHSFGPGLAYSRLLRFTPIADQGEVSTGVECDVCQSWEQPYSDVYIFHLRRDVRWHDISPVNGRLLVADDVVFSLQRQKTPGWPNARLLQSMKSIEALDDFTVKITLVAPDADFLMNLADTHSKIVAPEIVSRHGDLVDAPVVGTGPWIVQETTERRTVLRGNPYYFQIGKPYLDKLIIKTIEDSDTRGVALRVHELDVGFLRSDEWHRLRLEHPEIQGNLSQIGNAGLELAMNSSIPPFNDIRVRQSVLFALDPWVNIEESAAGVGVVGLGHPLTKFGWGLNRSDLEQYFGDPATARILLDDASGGNLPVAFDLTVGDFGPGILNYAELVVNQLEAVGFDPRIKIVTLDEFKDKVWFGGEYSMFLGVSPPMNTPNVYLLTVLHGGGIGNTHGYEDNNLNRLIELQSVETNIENRQLLIHDIQHQAFESAVRFMPMTLAEGWVWWVPVANLHPNLSSGEYLFWSNVWMEDN